LAVQDPFTGRANLRAEGAGILQLDRAVIDAVNAVDPAITVATLPEWQRVEPGTMVATIKIIPYAVQSEALQRAIDAATAALSLRGAVFSIADLIVTTLPGAPTKSQPVHDRLTRLGLTCRETQVPHETNALAEALAQGTAPLRLILTASATSDAADVGPSAVRQAGGVVERVGMPVDPGNLLFLATLGEASVIGLPGCARSPALNGADWVLERIACGVPVSGSDIARMGVGGLLGEIPTRPQPRAGAK
jgi:molybdenum cofactor cytidylyltransferase